MQTIYSGVLTGNQEINLTSHRGSFIIVNNGGGGDVVFEIQGVTVTVEPNFTAELPFNSFNKVNFTAGATVSYNVFILGL